MGGDWVDRWLLDNSLVQADVVVLQWGSTAHQLNMYI